MPWMRNLNRPTGERMALLKNQVSELLWYGKIETTFQKSKEVSRLADKIISLAIRNYEDVVKVNVTVKDEKGKETTKEVIKDGVKKLNARRKIIAMVRDIQEIKKPSESKTAFTARTADIKHPLIEKIFNELAPKYAKRAKEKGQNGGYVRIVKTGFRRGDNADMAVITLVD
jgi:large subunit ribosomal protein L17